MTQHSYLIVTAHLLFTMEFHCSVVDHNWQWELLHFLSFLFSFQGSNVVEDQDLLEIGILNSSHRQRILQAVRGLPRVS